MTQKTSDQNRLAALITELGIKTAKFAGDRFDKTSLEGPALRALHTFLQQADSNETWCGLSKTVTNDGNILWLCEEHKALHQ